MADLISVIVPVFNVEAYLGKCIDSILVQSYRDFEVLLIDDGSTDGSGAICDDYANRYDNIIAHHKENSGASDARNHGLSMAGGNLVCFVDSDDLVRQDYLRSMYDNLKRTGADIAISRIETWKDGAQEPDLLSGATSDAEVVDGKEALLRVLYNEVSVSPCGKLYKAGLFAGGGFPRGRMYEDVLATPSILMQCKSAVIDGSAHYCYRMRRESTSHEPLTERSFDRFELAREVHDAVMAAYDDGEFTAAARRYLVCHALSVLRMDDEEGVSTADRLEELRKVVKSEGKSVLRDPRAGLRDKAAILSSFLGNRFYHFCWKAYSLMTGRIM